MPKIAPVLETFTTKEYGADEAVTACSKQDIVLCYTCDVDVSWLSTATSLTC